MKDFDIDNVHIRWMIRRDWPEVLEIERANFEFPWTKEVLEQFLQQRFSIGMVAEFNQQVVGFINYELRKDHYLIVSVAVRRDLQRLGIGRKLVGNIIKKFGGNHVRSRVFRSRIETSVRESNLFAQLFFKELGFVASSVLKGVYEGTDEDAYEFVFHRGWTS